MAIPLVAVAGLGVGVLLVGCIVLGARRLVSRAEALVSRPRAKPIESYEWVYGSHAPRERRAVEATDRSGSRPEPTHGDAPGEEKRAARAAAVAGQQVAAIVAEAERRAEEILAAASRQAELMLRDAAARSQEAMSEASRKRAELEREVVRQEVLVDETRDGLAKLLDAALDAVGRSLNSNGHVQELDEAREPRKASPGD